MGPLRLQPIAAPAGTQDLHFDVREPDGDPANQVMPQVLDDLAQSGLPRAALLSNVEQLSSFLDSPVTLDREMERRGFARTEHPESSEVRYTLGAKDPESFQLLRVQWDAPSRTVTGVELSSESPHFQQKVQCATEEHGQQLDETDPLA